MSLDYRWISKKKELDETASPAVPLLLIRDWFDFFLSNSCMHILHGLKESNAAREEEILDSFWKHFGQVYPDHQVFREEKAGRLNLRRALPLLLHGDEGRGRKHVAHFVMSFHSVLGLGFRKDETSRKASKTRMECNFEGHTYTNRFLIATLRKRDYSDDQAGTWTALMRKVAEESRFMWETGVANRDGLRYWGIIISITGDWPFLHKSADFGRSFNNVQKRVTVRSEPVGCCHLCQAGQRHVQFEQLATRRPAWAETMFVQDPFNAPSPYVNNILHEPSKEAAIWAFDWFHTMHLGVMKNFLGSVLALMSQEEVASAVNDRFHSLSEKYKLWCHRFSRRAFISKLTKESIQWETTAKFPTGTWHKGALSTTLMEFCEHRFATEAFQHPLLHLAAEACTAIQRCSRGLYRAGVWLSPDDSNLIAELGFKFLRRYSSMATLAKNRRESFFILQPKIHVLHHFLFDLHVASQKKIPAMNPLAKSCQQSEDFIGRPARLSRRVTAQRPVLHRVMDRYQQSAYHHFIAAGYLVRPRWFFVTFIFLKHLKVKTCSSFLCLATCYIPPPLEIKPSIR